MGHIDTETIKQHINNLSAVERQQIYAFLKVNIDRKGVTRTAVFDRSETLVCRYLSEITGFEIHSAQALGIGFGVDEYKAAVAVVSNFVAGSVPERTNILVIEELIGKCLACLKEYLESTDTPVTPTSMLKNMEYLPYSVDQCFPGYAKAKLLHFIAGMRRDASVR